MTNDNDDMIFVPVIIESAKRSPVLDKLPEGARLISGGSLASVFYEAYSSKDVQMAIERISLAINAGLSKASPQSCTVELNLGFKAGVKVPVIMSGEANSGIKITLSWENKK